MSKQDIMKMQSCVLRVNIHCDGCKHKVKKLLQKIDGVYSTSINAEQGKVTVTGNVDPVTLLKKLEKSGKYAELWGGQKKVANNMMNNNNMFKNMQMKNGKGGKNKSHKGAKDPQKNGQQIKGLKDLNLPKKPVKFNVPFDENEFDDNEIYDDSEFDEDGVDDDSGFDDQDFNGHHHHQKIQHKKLKPFMCNGHEFGQGPKKRGNGKKGGTQNKGKNGSKNKNGGKEKIGFKFPLSFKGLLRKFEEKKCGNEMQKGCGNGGEGKKGGKIKNQGKNGGQNNGGLNGGVKVNGRSKKKGGNNGGGAGEGGHSIGSWDMNMNMNMNEAIKKGGFNEHKMGHNGGSGGRHMGHVGQMGNYPKNQMDLDQIGRMGYGNSMGNYQGQMGIDQMGQMRNTNPMGHMVNIPTVHGPATAGAMPGGYYQGMGQEWNPYYQQQQQYMAAMMMNQQHALNGTGMYQSAMQGRPPLPMSYGPTMPPPVTIKITDYFSDENPNNCSIM